MKLIENKNGEKPYISRDDIPKICKSAFGHEMNSL